MTEPKRKRLAPPKVTLDEQALSQVEQALSQVEQGASQVEVGVTQIKEGLGHGVAADAIAAHTVQIMAITEGVAVLAQKVDALNRGVYAKNRLDRIRNGVIIGAVIALALICACFSVLLWRVNETAQDRGMSAPIAGSTA